MGYDHEDRRAADTTQADIKALLLMVTDPKDKAMVLLFQQVSGNQEHLADMLRFVAEKQTEQGLKLDAQVTALTDHSTNELVVAEKFKTAYKIISGLSVIAIAAASAWYGDYRALVSSNAAQTILLTEHSSALKTQRKDIDLLQEFHRIQDSIQKNPKQFNNSD